MSERSLERGTQTGDDEPKYVPSAVTNAVDTELYFPSESERVICWRASELIAAGFDTPVAVELAERPDVDLHAALELLEHGCAPEIAARILL